MCWPARVKWILPSYSKIGLNRLLLVVTALLFVRGIILENKVEIAEEYRKLSSGQWFGPQILPLLRVLKLIWTHYSVLYWKDENCTNQLLFICLNVTLQIIILLVKRILCLCDKTEEAVIFTSSGYIHYHRYQL